MYERSSLPSRPVGRDGRMNIQWKFRKRKREKFAFSFVRAEVWTCPNPLGPVLGRKKVKIEKESHVTRDARKYTFLNSAGDLGRTVTKFVILMPLRNRRKYIMQV